jgi:uncharacterized protein with GYD domain
MLRGHPGEPDSYARRSREGRPQMPKYLIIASLTQEGIRGSLNEGGTARREAIRRATESLGGKLEAFYYAFGESDVYSIVEMPDNAAAAAASMAVSAAGVSRNTTVVLIAPEEMDEVSKKNRQGYVPPRT